MDKSQSSTNQKSSVLSRLDPNDKSRVSERNFVDDGVFPENELHRSGRVQSETSCSDKSESSCSDKSLSSCSDKSDWSCSDKSESSCLDKSDTSCSDKSGLSCKNLEKDLSC